MEFGNFDQMISIYEEIRIILYHHITNGIHSFEDVYQSQ